MARPGLDPDDEWSVTVAEAARRLGCDASTVRTLLHNGQLAGHRIGKGDRPRGVRVHASSIRAYKDRHAIGAEPATDTAPPKKRRRPNAAHEEAVAYLRSIGVRV